MLQNVIMTIGDDDFFPHYNAWDLLVTPNPLVGGIYPRLASADSSLKVEGYVSTDLKL